MDEGTLQRPEEQEEPEIQGVLQEILQGLQGSLRGGRVCEPAAFCPGRKRFARLRACFAPRRACDGQLNFDPLGYDTVVCLTLAKWETVSGRFGGYLTTKAATSLASMRLPD